MAYNINFVTIMKIEIKINSKSNDYFTNWYEFIVKIVWSFWISAQFFVKLKFLFFLLLTTFCLSKTMHLKLTSMI